MESNKLNFKFYINTSRQIQVLKRVDCLAVRVKNVDKSLVSSKFKLLTRVLILMNSSQDSNNFLSSRKRDRTRYLCTCSLSCLNNLSGAWSIRFES